MISGKRYVIAGLNRLTARVAPQLAARGAEVVVLHGTEPEDVLADLLGDTVQRLAVRDISDDALRDAGIAGADCLLALSEEDMVNIRTTVLAREIAPEVPVVLRAFDPTLADQLEQGLNVRRAYSVSALAAPAFVAAALAEEVIETLHMGDTETPICRLRVREGSPMAGKTARELKREFRCGVLARTGTGGAWQVAVEDAAAVAVGEEVLIGGRLEDVLDLARRNSPLFEGKRPRPIVLRARDIPWRGRSRRQRLPNATLLPIVGAALTSLLVAAVIVFWQALRLSPIDALYQVINTAHGNINLADKPTWLKLFGCSVMLAGGALLAVIFSHLSSVATAERLEEQMGRRAARLTRHVVIAGLGNVGYRVADLLCDLGIDVAVVERAPDTRFLQAVRGRAAVLSGDARLAEDLERASIRDAVAFLACTNDDLANIQACLHARRLNPAIRTVARVFDDRIAERLTQAFQIDAAISSARVAASAFVSAATDERALRSFRVGDLPYLALRYDVPAPTPLTQIETWRAGGIRVLAFRRDAGPVEPPTALTEALAPGDTAILAGPEAALHALLGL
jgi:Trk K+ transport system NAD-binding subunit